MYQNLYRTCRVIVLLIEPFCFVTLSSAVAVVFAQVPYYSTRPQTLTLLNVEGNFTTYFLSLDKLPIDMKMLVLFLGKCVRTAAKAMVVDRKTQKALALLYLASGTLQNAVNSSVVPTSSQQNRQQR